MATATPRSKVTRPFTVRASNIVGATPDPVVAVATIVNDDVGPGDAGHAGCRLRPGVRYASHRRDGQPARHSGLVPPPSRAAARATTSLYASRPVGPPPATPTVMGPPLPPTARWAACRKRAHSFRRSAPRMRRTTPDGWDHATGRGLHRRAMAPRHGRPRRPPRLRITASTQTSLQQTAPWTAVDALDFSSPPRTTDPTGALDGNLAANRAAVSATIVGLAIPPGATFLVRWIDLNASGAPTTGSRSR